MVALNRLYQFKFLKSCLPQSLPGPFLTALTQIILNFPLQLEANDKKSTYDFSSFNSLLKYSQKQKKTWLFEYTETRSFTSLTNISG